MKQVAAALVKAQRQFSPALKSATNPHFKTKYADLSACVEAVIDALGNNGIFLSQPCHESDTGVIVETIFLHESGESFSAGRLHVPASKQDPQGYGSALTYARRYSLMAACGIAPEDDDGNAGSKKPEGKGEGKPSATAAAPDMSPKARAARIATGVAAGDAVGAAKALAGLDDALRDEIWAHLNDATQKKLTAAWPKETA